MIPNNCLKENQTIKRLFGTERHLKSPKRGAKVPLYIPNPTVNKLTIFFIKLKNHLKSLPYEKRCTESRLHAQQKLAKKTPVSKSKIWLLIFLNPIPHTYLFFWYQVGRTSHCQVIFIVVHRDRAYCKRCCMDSNLKLCCLSNLMRYH